MKMKKVLSFVITGVAAAVSAAVSEKVVLWRNGDDGIRSYRIPALCTAPNGDLVAACDARKNNAGDLNVFQPINITVRRSSNGGKSWTKPENSWTWAWNDSEKWSGSDPSFIVDEKAGKIFLFYNVWKWEDTKKWDNNVYRFFVQESSDNGKTWSKPRDISADISFPEWPFGKARNKGGFIFLSSGSGIQTRDGTLLHTIVHVGDGNALFGSDDHGKTWKAFGKPVKKGDECDQQTVQTLGSRKKLKNKNLTEEGRVIGKNACPAIPTALEEPIPERKEASAAPMIAKTTPKFCISNNAAMILFLLHHKIFRVCAERVKFASATFVELVVKLDIL